jgi:3-oxoacyl-[acyl-carrier-protein] synthase II
MTPSPREVCIADTAVVTALGDSLEAAWRRLCRGETAIGPVRRFSTERLDYHNAACMGDLDEPPQSGENRVSALMRRALEQLAAVPSETFVIWTGVKGSAEFVERKVGRDKETAWGEMPRLPVHFRRMVCRSLGLPAESGMELNAACAASTVGLAVGARMIESGEQESVLVCAADIVSRFTFMGFSALKALSPTTTRPFDAERDGLSLGDGAAAILMAGRAFLEREGREPLARLTGWGVANDANHITGPARDGCGLIQAIRSALEQAGREPDAIEAFCAHGTGTPYNDAMELTALESVFGERRFPLFSVKGAVGHTLGAAGAAETAVCVRALQEGIVPATCGFRRGEERTAGRVAPEAQAFAGNNILTTNSGFGGVNAALVIERCR